jgi:hypothetical protein
MVRPLPIKQPASPTEDARFSPYGYPHYYPPHALQTNGAGAQMVRGSASASGWFDPKHPQQVTHGQQPHHRQAPHGLPPGFAVARPCEQGGSSYSSPRASELRENPSPESNSAGVKHYHPHGSHHQHHPGQKEQFQRGIQGYSQEARSPSGSVAPSPWGYIHSPVHRPHMRQPQFSGERPLVTFGHIMCASFVF